MRRACLSVLLSAILLAGCKGPLVLNLPGAGEYVRIAEGLSSPTITEAIRVAPRGFAPSQLVQACKNPRSVARFDTPLKTIDLQVGERFALTGLSIVAVSFADVAMEDVPITLEAQEFFPPVLQLRSDDPELNMGVLYSLNTGTARMRIRTLCSGPGVETTIVFRILP
jgi:hypothetical protein